MTEQAQELDNQERTENARVGYQAATMLWTYEGELVWSKFNAMLVANSIILAIIGLIITSQRELPVFSIGMPIAGLILCLLWFLATKRGFDSYIYWILSARELEEQHLSDPVKTVCRGGDLADGRKIQLTINGKKKDYQMSWFGRLLRVEWVSYLVIALFAVMYILVMLHHLRSVYGGDAV